MGFDTRGSVQATTPFTCSKISRLKRREIFLLSQLLANAEENLSIFRHLLHCLKHLIDFRCFYLQIQLFAKSLSLFAFSRNG